MFFFINYTNCNCFITGNSEEVYLFPSATGETGSDSNISVRLCEIEDSELEEFLPQEGKYSSE